MEELKKCPFCNREAELRYDKDGFSFVVCANDGCYARTDDHLNEDAAITAWNIRKPLERIVERLGKLKENAWDEEYQTMCDVIEIVEEELS